MTFAPMHHRLETERLLLEPWTDVAVETYQALIAERGEGTPTAEDIEQRLHGQRERYRTDGIALLALHRRAERDVIAGRGSGRRCARGTRPRCASWTSWASCATTPQATMPARSSGAPVNWPAE